ncbi:hypothetical protein KGF54_002229 [Candida jiufengensis]|uniref:uncharacterized protein n=1 Tax=Candida jiufengensis TaxID=497108 RepID=UPI0022252FC9|nr:uncharacterized protein KGF54_002229 [Candida jiufengensis]KAI5954454.1 hypothetical protein KGF54_002229 [Candida jiufengensis]
MSAATNEQYGNGPVNPNLIKSTINSSAIPPEHNEQKKLHQQQQQLHQQQQFQQQQQQLHQQQQQFQQQQPVQQFQRQPPVQQQFIKPQPNQQFRQPPQQQPPQIPQQPQQQKPPQQAPPPPPQSNDASYEKSKEQPEESRPKQSEPPKPTNKTPNEHPHKMKKKLVRKAPDSSALKYKLWLTGHLMALGFGSISFLFQILWLPNIWYINSISYRLSLIGSMLAFTATFSHKFGLHFLPPIASLLSHQNFQYLILAFVWCFTFKSIFKIIPLWLISLLHMGKLKNISFILKESSFLASFIAYDELVLIVYLLLRTLFFRNASGYQLSLFLVFYWLRILYNKETGNLFGAIVERLDGRMTELKNPKVKHYWYKIKEFIKEKQIQEQHDS